MAYQDEPCKALPTCCGQVTDDALRFVDRGSHAVAHLALHGAS